MQSRPKPSHHSAEYGAWFKDPLVASAYPQRPPYPDDLLAFLPSLLSPAPDGTATVLDLGAGTGDIARRLAPLAPRITRVDAIDQSPAMIAQGKSLPGGHHPNLHWILGTAEEAPLDPPYALATAGESLHWMDWDIALPRVARALAPGAVLAIAERYWNGPPALSQRLLPIFNRYSPVRDYLVYDMYAELTSRGLFAEQGRLRFGPAPWTPTVAEYVECRHSQRGFSRTHIGPEAVTAFDAAIVNLLAEACQDGTIQEQDGRLQLEVTATLVWGTPAPGAPW